MRIYKLEGHTPVPCTIHEFRKTTIVEQTIIDHVRVSTVFLGLDHSFSEDGPPILFETMIFGGTHDNYQERYETWEQAEAGHKKAVALCSQTQ